ncbi:MAG TPA: inositol-3-phosphate synthase, partial [Pirellulales bacterium]|nr:inositol-3-phosphate synthase [Pirellulales bacterium]
MIGAKGGVASTATVGLIALQKNLIGQAGLVSELTEFAALELADWNDFVVGGHEIRDVRLYDEALRMHRESRAIDLGILEKCQAEIDRIDGLIRPGTLSNVGPTIASLAADEARAIEESPRQAVERLQNDLRSFAQDRQLEHVIVVNVSSTEPPVDTARFPERWSELEKLLDQPQSDLPASSLYAIAALDLGFSYLNFTPSLGASLPAIDELARERGTRHYGYDGKTGETLLKSVLAPMFRKRNLGVMSWVGHNIFGNMDARVLDDPANKQAK